MTGRFVAFEGADASGKSTQARLFAERRGSLLTREPGGTALGERIRSLVLDPADRAIGDRTEALLMAAARAQHVDEVVRPALAAGREVVSDRYYPSSLAYQGHGRGLDIDAVRALSMFAIDGVEPDHFVLIEVPVDVAVARLGPDRDRIEGAGEAFQVRVRAGYDALVAADPERWIVVDGVGAPDVVADRVAKAFAERTGSAP